MTVESCVLSFDAAEKMLKGKSQKKLENNTYLVVVDKDTFGIKLHETIVVYIFRGGRYQLNTGGWKSVTTKDRLNRYSPVRIHQAGGIWYIGDGVFEDGVIVNSDGTLVSNNLRVPDLVQKRNRELNRKIRTYVDDFAAYVVKHGLKVGVNDVPPQLKPFDVVRLTDRPEPLCPGPIDCWACFFGLQTEDPLKEPLGVGHLLDHMKENYFVPSLLWKAIVTAGYVNPGFIWQHIAEDAKQHRDRTLKNVLTGYFRKRKPALLDMLTVGTYK